MTKLGFHFVQTLKWSVLFGLIILFSCKSDDTDVGPDISAQLTGKWWCGNNNNLSDQYFGADGAFQQRFNGKVDTGKWKLSQNKKTIAISEVTGYLVGNWTYNLKEVSESKLVLNYLTDYTFSPCP